jgi:hypothetical protein
VKWRGREESGAECGGVKCCVVLFEAYCLVLNCIELYMILYYALQFTNF